MKPKLLNLALIAAALVFAGCGTVAPKEIKAPAPSLSSTGLDSGVPALINGQWIVNQDWVNRYNALIALGWGRIFHPAIKQNQGVTPLTDVAAALGKPGNYYSVAPMYLADKAKMEARIRKGEKPPSLL